MTDAPRIFSSGRFEFEGTQATQRAYTLRSLCLDQIELDREAAERRKELTRDLTVNPILRFVSDSDTKSGNQLTACVDKAIAMLDKHYCEPIARLYVAQGLKRGRP